MDNKKQTELENNSLESDDSANATVVIPDGHSPAANALSSVDTGVVNPDAAKVPKVLQKEPLSHRLLDKVNIYIVLLFFILLILAAISFVAISQSKKNATDNSVKTQALNKATVDKLAGTDSSVGDATQTLTVQSNAIFKGGVLVYGALDVAGTLKIGGSLSLPSLTVGGQTTVEKLAAKSFTVSADAAIQGKLIAQGGMAVTGNSTFSGQVSAGQILTDKLVLNGDLQLIRHIVTNGGTPNHINGSALGSGGTASNSGSDTTGTVIINTGNSAPAGCFVTITFTNAFGAIPHVVISPSSSSAATVDYYTNRTTTGFSICSATDAPDNTSNIVFDYFVAG